MSVPDIAKRVRRNLEPQTAFRKSQRQLRRFPGKLTREVRSGHRVARAWEGSRSDRFRALDLDGAVESCLGGT
eukprot:3660864-Rhodomonas_salina.2